MVAFPSFYGAAPRRALPAGGVPTRRERTNFVPEDNPTVGRAHHRLPLRALATRQPEAEALLAPWLWDKRHEPGGGEVIDPLRPSRRCRSRSRVCRFPRALHPLRVVQVAVLGRTRLTSRPSATQADDCDTLTREAPPKPKACREIDLEATRLALGIRGTADLDTPEHVLVVKPSRSTPLKTRVTVGPCGTSLSAPTPGAVASCTSSVNDGGRSPNGWSC